MNHHPIQFASVLLSLTLVLVATSSCDEKDEEAQRRQEQAYIDEIVDQVGTLCACSSRECSDAASKKLTKIQEEAEAKVDGWPSSEVHARLLPEMEKAGQCQAANI